MTTRRRQLAAGVLLIGGIAIWAMMNGRAFPPRASIVAVAIALVAAAVPTSRESIASVLRRCRRPTPRRRAMIAVILGVASIAYILFTAWQQDRDRIPKFHDEFMHLLQMRMLAHGRLAMPPHPHGEFFESFHVLVRPVCASIYFPGTALLYLPTIWLNLPPWVMPLLAAGTSVGLLYRIVTEMIDGVAGLLAALMLVSLQMFRFMAMVVMSHGAIVMLGLLMAWAFLHWRRDKSVAWAAAVGAAAGWAAITRPLDSIAFAAPIGIAMVIALRRVSWPRRLATVAAVFIAAVPFLGLQLAMNSRVTGDPLLTPYQYYARQDSPGLEMGFAAIPADDRIASPLPQKQVFYQQFLRPQIQRHREQSVLRTLLAERLPLIARVTLPALLLVILVPASFLRLKRRGRWALASMPPLYLLLYTMFPFMLPHYALVAASGTLMLALIGKRAIEASMPCCRRAATCVFLTLAAAGLAIASLPQVDREVIDDGYLRPTMWFAAKEMPKRVRTPAIVFFRFTPGDDFHEEPVYNVDVLDPDDAPIIRAHDLGPTRNRELLEYYGEQQPLRTVYLYDRSAKALTELGNVAQLSGR